MRNTVSTYKLKRIIWGSVVCLFLFSSVFASNPTDAAKTNFNLKRTSSLIAQNLTQKLKADLIQENVSVKIENIEQTAISNKEIKLEGDAVCILVTEKTRLPIKFEAKINLAGQTVEDINYSFVESEYAPNSEEEVLMKELMKQISQDYKTQEIVIAIDNFETSDSNENKMQYKGIGEVRIGTIGWSKINFDVTLNSDKTAAKVAYKVQK